MSFSVETCDIFIHIYTIQALLGTQQKFQSLIPGFKFNLGFCGYYFDKGSEAEQLGNQKLVENANRFNWFGHIYNHYQPHNLTEERLVEYMTMNRKFAIVSFSSTITVHCIWTISYIHCTRGWKQPVPSIEC